jgi:hypothetical protein
MTRAAFAPFHNGRALLYVENIGALPTWEIGRIVCREHGRGGCAECAGLPVVKGQPLPLMRTITQANVETLTTDVMEVVLARGITHLVIEEAVGQGPEAERQAWIAGEMCAALLGVGVEVEMVPLPREGRSHDLSVRARALLAIAGGEVVPPKPRVDAPSRGHAGAGDLGAGEAREETDDALEDNANAVRVDGRTAVSGDSSGDQEGRERRNDRDVDRSRRAAGQEAEARGEQGIPATGEDVASTGGEVRAAVLVSGPRVAGIDPGSHWISVTVCARTPTGLVYVASLPVEVGRVEELVKPRTAKRADGSTYEVKRRRVIEDEDTMAAIAEVVPFLAAHGVEDVAVEMATHFHGSDDPARDRARAVGMLRAQRIGGKIEGVLCAGAVPSVRSVRTVSSKAARAAACKASGVKTWREAARVVVAGMPAVVNEHAVDAAVAAAWLERPVAEKRARTSRERKAQSESAKAAAKVRRDALRAEERRAKGCPGPPACVGRRHADACPIKIAANEARSHKMMGTANAAGPHRRRGDVPIGRPRAQVELSQK